MTVSPLKQNFDNDKKFLIDTTQEFLKNSSKFSEPLRAIEKRSIRQLKTVILLRHCKNSKFCIFS
ncbi:MAG: hypothetical protein O7C60_03590 [Rickettsia endosymbiont of Ixodes persulcatus]|nr:hypothetical protein [Rickettsia endosymbiont of Ixodes persulcatus]MCZ6909040.1 hypothetical protein [Rickettsia endosymbiont of Ixodes persulcatus]MCZ6909919.1 hypothetical protein [Rickettsia endosymbiont of Ixodes persulcatus]MCZ6919431.1 hypothetical protein [Rickettsia endosymbiont of Ixodes persulcatus]MCZ6924990.1 hypothetical protein [Rickettsia endosymbiont of Ixodes persulcatus]